MSDRERQTEDVRDPGVFGDVNDGGYEEAESNIGDVEPGVGGSVTTAAGDADVTDRGDWGCDANSADELSEVRLQARQLGMR